MAQEVLLQVSDTHFGTERPAVVDALARLSTEEAPTLLVVSGDVTQRARRAQFDAAAAFVRRLAVPRVLAIPGNHDIPLWNVASRLARPYAGFVRAFGEELEPVLDADGLLVVGVLTTSRMRHVDGAVSSRQVERVAGRLRRGAPGRLRIVVTHQPVCTPWPEDAPDRLHGAESAVRAWVAAGADLVLGGHIHRPYVAALHDAYPGLPRRAWAVQAGTAVSRRLRREADNSVNLIRWPGPDAARACVVERWDYRSGPSRFECVDRSTLPLDAPPGAG
jgi:3',5'-cyclic AMP phosphodiesterase CpdA